MSGRISLAILALGGQGGGVLADWILAVAAANGHVAQGTSVPGVAQRTGSTIYYIEMYPAAAEPPVMALSPVPGDVDIVIASELMEGGRALQRGFVKTGHTTLISSTHRIYAIAEKTARFDGRRPSERILEAARARASRFIGFDMEEAATRAGSVISSVMLGALAASRALPFPRQAYEAAIEAGGIAVAANLKGFAAGWDAATAGPGLVPPLAAPPIPTTEAGRALAWRVSSELPPPAQPVAMHGVQRLMDYQDSAYAHLYLDRLKPIAALDTGEDNHRLATETARGLALWMSYEDTIRVADLKTRDTRSTRVRAEVRAADDQLLAVTEYMHPRYAEVCETLPRPLGRFLLDSPLFTSLLAPLFRQGRHVTTTSLRWFLLLWLLSRARRFRRLSLRHHEERARITAWLALITDLAQTNLAAATALAECQILIKGYSDTHERGLRQYALIAAAIARHRHHPDLATRITTLRHAAEADEHDIALTAALATLDPAPPQPLAA
ncbi:indolepyruvate oxidoreductase subunit beta family protein [Polymorphobacter sp.]|uniref:indolepyruvate oxidoreductase subunit beta family protein n=1 Tax=Polymorphobacter sp. TaxID=1909290 RepID=UPI003F6E6F82